MPKIPQKLIEAVSEGVTKQVGGAFSRKGPQELKEELAARLDKAVQESSDKTTQMKAKRIKREIESAWAQHDSAPAEAKVAIEKKIEKLATQIPTSGTLAGSSMSAGKSDAFTVPEFTNVAKPGAYQSKMSNTALDDAAIGMSTVSGLDKIRSAVTGGTAAAGAIGAGTYSLGMLQDSAAKNGLGTPMGVTQFNMIEDSRKRGFKESPTSPTPTAPTPPAQGADNTGKKEVKAPSGFDVAGEYGKLLTAYQGLGGAQQKALQTSYDGLNKTIKEMNEGFEAQMAEAKGKAEKEKTRAEWASIASMLAKNIVGFGAALNGINPQAMAYETMDWGKRIADINQNMNTELSLLRETMRDKVNDARLQVAGAKEMADVGLRGKMAELDARGEYLRAQMREQGDTERTKLKAESDVAEAQAKAGQVTTKLEPPNLKGIFDKKKGESDEDVIGKVMAAGAQYGVTPEDIQAEIQKTDPGTLGFSKGDEITPKGQMAIIKLFTNKYKETITSRSDGAGQSPKPMVQSPDVGKTPPKSMRLPNGKTVHLQADGTYK